MQFTNNLPTILTIWIPLSLIILQIIIELTLPRPMLSMMHSEKGSHEIFQAAIIFMGFLIGLWTLLTRSIRRHSPYIIGWILLATLCCLYVAGEETSWGQHIFNWSTPEYWAVMNDQNETNLHNTSSWLDQKPRLLLELGVIVGGLIIPGLMKYRPHILPDRFKFIYPTSGFIVTAAIFLTLKLVDKADAVGFHPMTRISEVQEIFLFYFVLLYMLMMRHRVKLS